MKLNEVNLAEDNLLVNKFLKHIMKLYQIHIMCVAEIFWVFGILVQENDKMKEPMCVCTRETETERERGRKKNRYIGKYFTIVVSVAFASVKICRSRFSAASNFFHFHPYRLRAPL